MKCDYCNKNLGQNSSSHICDGCKRKGHTRAYFRVAIIILVLGFIGGIGLGDKYKKTELIYESSISAEYNEYETTFNGELMIYSWTGTALFDLFVFAIYSICYRLDLIIDKKVPEKQKK